MRKGTRYDEDDKKWKWTEEAEKEDEKKENEGESKEARMVRMLTPVMNSINKELVFTTELEEDFEDNKLPTLDCKLWLEKDLSINHTYYEKEMRTQLLIPEKSAMAQKQKMSILSNELVRRLSNICIDKAEAGEKRKVADHFTSQLKNSGYGRRMSREIVVAGILGWLRKIRRRKEEGRGFYRGAKSTLGLRMKKKLLDPTTWFRNKITEEVKSEVKQDKEGKESSQEPKKRKRKEKEEEQKTDNKKSRVDNTKSVIFCPYTPESELAKRLREVEADMEKMSGYRVKVVEEAGETIKDILHSSNPWRGENCGRTNCWLCRTKEMTGKGKHQDCTKRSLVYETWCETCAEKEREKVEREDLDDEEKQRKMKKIHLYKYVGETACSAYERGAEHLDALEKLSEESHMLKHIASSHSEEKIENIKFGFKVIKFTQSALERQVLESVQIQEERRVNTILNSRAEYSRCTIPRLTAKMGNADFDKKVEEETKEEKALEDLVKKEIAKRKKERCKRRGE